MYLDFTIGMTVTFFQRKRKNPPCLINEKYYPYLIVCGDNEYLEVNIINGPDPVPFDEEISASALPMDNDAHYEKLKKGTEFFVYEGQSMVGKGKVEDILPHIRHKMKRKRR